MTRLSWHDARMRLYETGLDRGVLYPKGRPAVAWTGLTAVEENGAESSTAYYIDGRPYLHVPMLKEFQATLKAYTYPDEFSEIMGLAEATDGMYLDSQMGDSFDLSYRTLIGNGSDGTAHEYKIHLIYNATVAPQSLSYSSLESAVNPVDFSWEIQAVPVAIQNYRSTAHIILDTRHLEPSKLRQVEDLLYGTDTETPTQLPRPSIIFDALNFGDGVIVVDNGDGTWTATGNYLDVLLDDNGVFTLNNVDVHFLPDGIFYFGDVPPELPTTTPGSDVDGGTPSAAGTGDVDGGTPDATGATDINGGIP